MCIEQSMETGDLLVAVKLLVPFGSLLVRGRCRTLGP